MTEDTQAGQLSRGGFDFERDYGPLDCPFCHRPDLHKTHRLQRVCSQESCQTEKDRANSREYMRKKRIRDINRGKR